MNLPGFRAEASLGPAGTTYRTAGRGLDAGGVSPAQQFRVGHFLVTKRCCQYVPSLGRFVCVERRHQPWVQCQCHNAMFGPFITCKDPVITF